MAEKKSDNPIPLFDGVQLMQTNDQGKGLFVTKTFRSGEEIFRCTKPYAVAVCSKTRDGLWEACHNCTKYTSAGAALVCDRCRVAAYCSETCRKEMLRVHLAECGGLRRLEERRSALGKDYGPFSDCARGNWPPTQLLLTARALNKKILDGMEEESKTQNISLISSGNELDKESEEHIIKMVRPLVLSFVTDEMILNMFRCASSGGTGIMLKNSLVSALYGEFTFINHACIPNCSQEDNNGQFVVHALDTVKVNWQLCISYIDSTYRMLPGEYRRKKIKELYGFDCKCYVCVSEQTAGSKMQRLDQQKRRSLAGISSEIAECAMAEGSDVLTLLIQLHNSKEWEKIIDIGTSLIQKFKTILHPKNVINYLILKALFEAYFKVSQLQKAIETFEVIKVLMKGYELERDVMKIDGLAAMCYMMLGRKVEAKTIIRKIPNFTEIFMSLANEGKIDFDSFRLVIDSLQ